MATTTLADSLLDDLDDLSDVDEQGNDDNHREKNSHNASMESPLVDSSQASQTLTQNHDLGTEDDERKPKQRLLMDDGNFKSHMEVVRSLMMQRDSSDKQIPSTSLMNESSSSTGTIINGENLKVTSEDRYNLIVNSNKYLQKLTTEYANAHSKLCRIYHAKFPELEELVVDPRQYKSAVRVIWNEMDMTMVNDELGNGILSSNQIITISVAGSTTSGRPLSDEELAKLDDTIIYMDGLTVTQTELTQFVEERMENLAPNICAIVGPTIAARLLGLAGGLDELSKIPACNFQVLGQVKGNASSRAGMSSSHSKPHSGIVGECELVLKCPGYMQKKAIKVVASKLALAARCDFVNAESGRACTADAGIKFRNIIESKIAKWDEPDKAQVVKALPKPDMSTKKRRGGKRIRRMKERFEETELMKQANKRAFSKEAGEYGDDAMGLSMGLLDSKESGKIRQTTEKKKMRQANTKASRKKALQLSSGTTNGLASSMVFTPVQGLELVNPNANRDRVNEANLKWFGENAGFRSALPKEG
eukprot:CAMPEP_0194373888 /NCGR_PEP_ID=MMETSP0174-20130528/22285_1 /TAXON_ID=216777 /ORGANISM="Proboscia alata, Strain PI-D3" /LENGTH=533 /DNA_ID=CAMNT_0039153167 /DNA_START=35 /DNA_END=1636 /DNA_ORIENTATION=-